jgi:hypothetical protein
MVPELNIQDLTVPEPNCQDGGPAAQGALRRRRRKKNTYLPTYLPFLEIF